MFCFTYILLANTVSIVWVLQFTLAVVSCSSVHPPIYTSIHSPTHQHMCLAIYLSSILLSTHTTICSSKHLPTHPQTNTTTQSIHTSRYPSSLLPCNHLPPFTHPLTYPSILSRTHFIGCIAQRVLSPFILQSRPSALCQLNSNPFCNCSVSDLVGSVKTMNLEDAPR